MSPQKWKTVVNFQIENTELGQKVKFGYDIDINPFINTDRVIELKHELNILARKLGAGDISGHWIVKNTPKSISENLLIIVFMLILLALLLVQYMSLQPSEFKDGMLVILGLILLYSIIAFLINLFRQRTYSKSNSQLEKKDKPLYKRLSFTSVKNNKFHAIGLIWLLLCAVILPIFAINLWINGYIYRLIFFVGIGIYFTV
jgi:hypothetical protein